MIPPATQLYHKIIIAFMGNKSSQSVFLQDWTIKHKYSLDIPGYPQTVVNKNGVTSQLYEIQVQSNNDASADMLTYEQRTNSISGHIVQVKATIKEHEKFLDCAGGKKYIRVLTQNIPYRFHKSQDLTRKNGLILLEGVLKGYQQITRFINMHFQPNQGMIGWNEKHVPKVWINPNFSKNKIFERSRKIGQQQMIWELINMISKKTIGHKLVPINSKFKNFKQAIQTTHKQLQQLNNPFISRNNHETTRLYMRRKTQNRLSFAQESMRSSKEQKSRISHTGPQYSLSEGKSVRSQNSRALIPMKKSEIQYSNKFTAILQQKSVPEFLRYRQNNHIQNKNKQISINNIPYPLKQKLFIPKLNKPKQPQNMYPFREIVCHKTFKNQRRSLLHNSRSGFIVSSRNNLPLIHESRSLEVQKYRKKSPVIFHYINKTSNHPIKNLTNSNSINYKIPGSINPQNINKKMHKQSSINQPRQYQTNKPINKDHHIAKISFCTNNYSHNANNTEKMAITDKNNRIRIITQQSVLNHQKNHKCLNSEQNIKQQRNSFFPRKSSTKQQKSYNNQITNKIIVPVFIKPPRSKKSSQHRTSQPSSQLIIQNSTSIDDIKLKSQQIQHQNSQLQPPNTQKSNKIRNWTYNKIMDINIVPHKSTEDLTTSKQLLKTTESVVPSFLKKRSSIKQQSKKQQQDFTNQYQNRPLTQVQQAYKTMFLQSNRLKASKNDHQQGIIIQQQKKKNQKSPSFLMNKSNNPSKQTKQQVSQQYFQFEHQQYQQNQFQFRQSIQQSAQNKDIPSNSNLQQVQHGFSQTMADYQLRQNTASFGSNKKTLLNVQQQQNQKKSAQFQSLGLKLQQLSQKFNQKLDSYDSNLQEEHFIQQYQNDNQLGYALENGF